MINDQPELGEPALSFVHEMLDVLRRTPSDTLQSNNVAQAASEFWRKVPKEEVSAECYLETWDHLWSAFAASSGNNYDANDAVNYAINNPAGRLTEDLLEFLWPEDAKVGGGLPEELSRRISSIVHRTDHTKVDASSVIVASRAEVVHAVDPQLAKSAVLPLLDWDGNCNAAAYWSAFLWPARISPDFFKLVERDCLAALQSPDRFNEDDYKRLCQVFLLASMEFKATSKEVVREILDKVGVQGLEHMSSFIRSRMLNSKEDATGYWHQTARPWIDTHWPRDAAKQTSRTMEDFAMIAVYSYASFPEALSWLEHNGLLGQTPTASTILLSLKKREGITHEDFRDTSTLPERFPKEVLRLLWLTRPFQWDHGYAMEILGRITEVQPALAETDEYQSIAEQLS